MILFIHYPTVNSKVATPTVGAVSSMLFGTIFSLYNLAVALRAKLPLPRGIGTARHGLVGMLGSAPVYFMASLLSKTETKKSESFIAKANLKLLNCKIKK